MSQQLVHLQQTRLRFDRKLRLYCIF